MKLKTFVEEWKDVITQYHNKNYDIFINPTPKELNKELGGNFRWMAHYPSKTVYASSEEILHNVVIKKLGLKHKKLKGMEDDFISLNFSSPDFFTGDFFDGKFDSDQLDHKNRMLKFQHDEDYKQVKEFVEILIKRNWSFAYKYLPGLQEWWEAYKKILIGNIK